LIAGSTCKVKTSWEGKTLAFFSLHLATVGAECSLVWTALCILRNMLGA